MSVILALRELASVLVTTRGRSKLGGVLANITNSLTRRYLILIDLSVSQEIPIAVPYQRHEHDQ